MQKQGRILQGIVDYFDNETVTICLGNNFGGHVTDGDHPGC